MDDDYLLLAAEEHRSGRQKALLVGKIALVALGVALLFALLLLRTWPPLNVVMSGSMEPTIETGDVVVMKRLSEPAEVGDIVAVHPPQEIQQRLNYPDTVIHRIVKITPDGTVYTKGDARKQRDPFTVPLDGIRSHVVATIPNVGQIVAFFTSPLGLIWIGVGLLLFVLLPSLEMRRDQIEIEQAELDSLTGMRLELREVANRVEGGYPGGAPPPAGYAGAVSPGQEPGELEEMRGTMDELVAAVGEYGEHLRSHTAVLQGMSSASQDLAVAVAALRGILPTTGAAPPTAIPPVPTPQPQAAAVPPPERPAWSAANQARHEAELFIRWQEQRAVEIATSMGFHDPLSAARQAPLDDAADDESIERKLWELAFENPHLLVS